MLVFFLARLILTPMLLCICNKYDLGRARAKKKKKLFASSDVDAESDKDCDDDGVVLFLLLSEWLAGRHQSTTRDLPLSKTLIIITISISYSK